jgi:hypothetical protein
VGRFFENDRKVGVANSNSSVCNAISNLSALYSERVDLDDAKLTEELFRNADAKWVATCQ